MSNRSRSSSRTRLAELEERTAMLIKEVASLREENAEVDRLRQENKELREKNQKLIEEVTGKSKDSEYFSSEVKNVDSFVYHLLCVLEVAKF